jgi:outer membrane protein OmpA-like peptidoglycan-associated protein
MPAVLTAQQGEAAGAKDHQMLKRVEGSSIMRQTIRSYDEFTIALEPVIWNYKARKFNEWKKLTAAGARTTTFYRMPENMSTLEALRNYENDLKSKGFQTLFTGFQKELDNGFGRFVKEVYNSEEDYQKQTYTMAAAKDYRYLAMKKGGPADVYFSGFFVATPQNWKDKDLQANQVFARIDLIETKAVGDRMVAVNAEQMASEIVKSGRVALYGIYFDFNKADLKPESAATLEEIAKYLKANESVKLLVAGHTDNVGAFESNRDLSQRRAKAVVAVLSEKYGIAAARLIPFGVSFAAPVASNETEDGRAKNRRVELVRL